jgi:threonine aldolase
VARYPFRTNDWHHIAYVWDENRTVLFVDGAMRSGGALSKQNDTSIDWSQTFDSFFIGGCREGNAADGLVDEFRIFSEPLTEQEIAA